jgi:hypothetical protein
MGDLTQRIERAQAGGTGAHQTARCGHSLLQVLGRRDRIVGRRCLAGPTVADMAGTLPWLPAAAGRHCWVRARLYQALRD